MNSYIPIQKRSKRAQKDYYAARRGSWDGLNPVSRVVPDKKKYDRRKQKQAEHRSGWERGSACFFDVQVRCCAAPAFSRESVCSSGFPS